ncbi:hypothetical protein Bca52824_091671 [Brassica carinata]|uniref:WIT1/2 N-terminal helical bundle domain-containing protein n=1 Tax=Brassica carinata TaxID=52824 RepID=A0A8X7TGL5_BRACI|nr:hypothetical protein Bca52824_091671 [Brassica carinata]
MEIETEHHKTLSVNDNDSLVPEPSSTKESLLEPSSAGLVLTKVELDFAFVAEKLLNLSLLIIQLCSKEHDLDSFVSHKEEAPSSNDANDSAEKALEFDLLSSILNSEVKEVESLLNFIQNEIQNAQAISKLHDAKQSLDQLPEVLEMKKQSSNLHKLSSGLELATYETSGDLSAKINTQNADQQRKFLRMLEKKSLAKEMELEKKLNESRNAEYELGMKLYSSSQDAAVYMEEVIEDRYSKWLEAENASKVFKGMSTEMSGKLQILHFNLSSSLQREENFEWEENLKSEIEGKECALHKLDSSNAKVTATPLHSEADGLLGRDSLTHLMGLEEGCNSSPTVNSLEEQLNDTFAAQVSDFEHITEDLKDRLAKTEARAEEAESRCQKLEESQKELQDELENFKGKGFTLEKLASLGKHLRDSDLQLEHAAAAVEASKEKQNLLYSTVSDMENVIKDLKSKVLKAENRAYCSEEKLIMVSESNKDLNEELRFCRGKLKEGERYIHQAEERKLRTTKDIALHNKIKKKTGNAIANLSRENRVLMVKLKKIGKTGYMESEVSPKSDQSSHKLQATITPLTNQEEEETESKPDVRSVRRVDAGTLRLKQVLVSIFVILMASVAYFISQQNS